MSNNPIEQIKKPISREMDLFEGKFYAAMKTKVSLLDRIMQYIVLRKGKQMRPIFVFLCAKLFADEINPKTYRAASLIELIHTASLVHDDVVDDSDMRRGFFSINALWKNKIAVLVGDFLLSRSMMLAIDHDDFDLLKLISNAIRKMSEGELLQLEKARNLDITEEVYFEIIEQKTASLIGACCEAGTRSTNQSEEDAKKMYQFGLYAGLAFQIKDDLFDYTHKNIIGKPVGIDIKEQKMTLPLIYLLNTSDKKDRRWLLNGIKKHNNNKVRVREIIEFVKEKKGLEYAISRMREYQEKSKEILYTFPESAARNSLELLLDYVIEREH